MSDTPMIYVACLAAYNAGYLHGRWIDATQDWDCIQDEIQTMLSASPMGDEAEEYALHDYEGFDGLELSEYEDLEQVQQMASFIEEHGQLGAHLLSAFNGNIDGANQAFEQYCGRYPSLADYMQELTESNCNIPSSLDMYIDYQRMGEDAEMSGDLMTFELGMNEVHVFWRR